jgi:UDP-GlcNAc:undecaprenyl-phosphate/decaprenyl-phosphate GlcNAc-1-phosphate transferase
MESIYLAALVGLVVSATLTPLFAHYGRLRNLVDVPDGMGLHECPTPRTGGRAIALGIAAGITVGAAMLDIQLLLALSLNVVLISLAVADEKLDLPRRMRLLVQLGVAAATVGAFAYWAPEPLRSHLTSGAGILLLAAAVIWMTWMVNAYNFLDGVNGIASATAIVAGLALAVLFVRIGDPAGAVVALAIAGAAAGFIPWNLRQGRVFMGDVGSTTFGYLFAFLALRAAARGMLIPAVLPLLPMLFDTTTTLLSRMLKGEQFFSTRHRNHLYQRLAVMGWPHEQVTALWTALAVACSVAALTWSSLTAPARAALLLGLVAIHIAIAVQVIWLQRRRGSREQLESRGLRLPVATLQETENPG